MFPIHSLITDFLLVYSTLADFLDPYAFELVLAFKGYFNYGHRQPASHFYELDKVKKTLRRAHAIKVSEPELCQSSATCSNASHPLPRLFYYIIVTNFCMQLCIGHIFAKSQQNNNMLDYRTLLTSVEVGINSRTLYVTDPTMSRSLSSTLKKRHKKPVLVLFTTTSFQLKPDRKFKQNICSKF